MKLHTCVPHESRRRLWFHAFGRKLDEKLIFVCELVEKSADFSEQLVGRQVAHVYAAVGLVLAEDHGRGARVFGMTGTSFYVLQDPVLLVRTPERFIAIYLFIIYLFIYLWIPQRLVYSINLSRGSPCMYLCTNTIGTEIRWRNRE